jgi:hypothetical protein
MLIYDVSLKLQLPSCVTIHNQCLNTELVSPVYFGNGAVYFKLFDQQVDIGSKMRVSFEINATQEEFECALLYKLQIYSDRQHGIDTSITENNDNKAKCVQMFIAWKVKDFSTFVHIALIEHAREFVWNEDKLRRLYNKNHNWLKEHNVASTKWLVDDNMTLKTSLKVRGLKGNFELSIAISGEEKDDYAVRPLCVDLER